MTILLSAALRAVFFYAIFAATVEEEADAASFSARLLYPLQLNKLLRHTDRSCELVYSTLWILSQQIVREKKLDSECICLTFKSAVRVECLCVHENRV